VPVYLRREGGVWRVAVVATQPRKPAGGGGLAQPGGVIAGWPHGRQRVGVMR